ncbi:MAG: hypothetical protein KJ600_05860 [Nanoarchaeota archaeon]|nr:hypothetical protein [Nanoarchaeota archaeon]MBU1104054.1 hypothetical protein [Nanoarchaeota archaeon]
MSNKLDLKEDDVVFCTVKKIEGTTVFLEIEGSDKPGAMVLSEVAAGRIRNLRLYVSPNRKIVCKVLRVMPGHVEMSLRRVTAKEKKEVLEGYKKENSLRSVLKVVKEDAEGIISKIKEDYNLVDFLAEVKENSGLLEKFMGKENAKKVFQIISEKQDKNKIVEKKIILTCDSEQGVKDIREILDFSDAEIHYLGSSKFSMSVSAKDFKEANARIEEILEEIEKRAKKKKAVFEVKKEK